MPNLKEQWHLDRRIPIALIITIVVQTSVGVWWAATTTSQVAENSREIAELKAVTGDIPSRLSRIETRQEHMLQSMKEIARKLER